jgi:Rod binding domain-containing protein
MVLDMNSILQKPLNTTLPMAPIHQSGHAVSALLSGEQEHQQLTQSARKLVAQTFFGTLLKQMRDSPFKSELFSGGRGGEVFGEMRDQHLAERMADGAGRRLADSIVKHIERTSRKRLDPSRLARDSSLGSLERSVHAP